MGIDLTSATKLMKNATMASEETIVDVEII
jgi:hypothetical protein